MKKNLLTLVLALAAMSLNAQYVSSVWKADIGGGKYQNPIMYADYSDPSVCAGPDGYYMTASSFNCVPGLPILFSTDLVNWTLVSHALPVQYPEDHFTLPQHGNGVWAPAIRYHNGEFYIYWGDPDFGIYMVKTKDARGTWSKPVMVKEGKGLIDPSPLWDEDGKAWLAFAFAGSRRGLKSVLLMSEMTYDGTQAIGQARIIYDGHEENPTIEGTKLYKYKGRYYNFSPSGGVATGWQEVLRADHPWGPWEAKTVMIQGETPVNGPHQGCWVRTPEGEDWFLHFQDVGPVGRIVHLNPMTWTEDGWPVIGVDKDGDGVGEPVLKYNKPKGLKSVVCTPQESDDFDQVALGLQWQWHGNVQPEWYYIDPRDGGRIRLFADDWHAPQVSLWDATNLLLQKIPAPNMKATSLVRFVPREKTIGERGGLVVMGMDYGVLSLEQTENGLVLTQRICKKADRGGKEELVASQAMTNNKIYMRVAIKDGNQCQFYYSEDGKKYQAFGKPFEIREGKWIGAKVGLYCSRAKSTNDSGWLEAENFIISK